MKAATMAATKEAINKCQATDGSGTAPAEEAEVAKVSASRVSLKAFAKDAIDGKGSHRSRRTSCVSKKEVFA